MKKLSLVMQQDETDCAAACLASIAKYYGKNISINRIRYYAGTDIMGTSGVGIVKGSEKLGFTCKGMYCSSRNINDSIITKNVVYPFIAHINKKSINHYVVVYGIKNKKVIIGDPDAGYKKISIKDFNNIWSGIFFIVFPDETFKKTKDSKNIFERFFYLLKPYKKSLIECFIAGLVLCVLGVISAFYFRYLIDEVLYSQLESSLFFCSLGYFFVIVFQNLIDFSRNQIMNYLGNKIDLFLICDYFKHILYLPMEFFSSRKTGEIISRLADANIIRETISSTSLSVIIDSCMLIFGGIFLFIFGSSLLIPAMIPVFISAFLAWIFIKPFKIKIKELSEKEADKQSTILECVNGIGTIKALSSEFSAFLRGECKIVDCVKKSINLGTMANIQRSLQNFVSNCGTLILYCYGSYLILKGQMTLGQLISFITLSGYFLGPLSRLLTLQQSLQQSVIASNRLGEILDLNKESEENNSLVELKNIKGKIELKNVSFSYGTRGLALKNINIKINPGEKVAFVGSSGSGKTTITKLLMKFYKAMEGEILIDGKNINDINTDSLRKFIGYVPQEVLLFNGTIIENIMWGVSGYSVEDVIKVCKMAQAENFINKLPERYNTVIGEKGSSLSGGERQRIALARVLLRNPDFFIFDEATASLDAVSEHLIMNTINSFPKAASMIIVAHRLSTIKNCDKIFVFDEGTIVQEGTHEELLKINGKYKDLWKAQN